MEIVGTLFEMYISLSCVIDCQCHVWFVRIATLKMHKQIALPVRYHTNHFVTVGMLPATWSTGCLSLVKVRFHDVTSFYVHATKHWGSISCRIQNIVNNLIDINWYVDQIKFIANIINKVRGQFRFIHNFTAIYIKCLYTLRSLLFVQNYVECFLQA